MNNKTWFSIFGGVGLALALVVQVFGYVIHKDTGGYVITWAVDAIPSAIPLQIKLATSPALFDGTSQSSSVQLAMTQWNSVLGTVQLAPEILVPGTYKNGNGISEIVMDSTIDGEPFGEGTLAVTISYRNGNTRTEADIIFNTAYTWDSYRGSLRVAEDIRRVAVHELGHVLGLGHPDLESPPQSVTAIMNSTVSTIDTLQNDDINGVRSLYGASSSGPTNNNFANALTISPSSSSSQVTGTNIAATAEAGEPALDPDDPGGKTVWWKWTAPAGGSSTITTLGSNFDTLLGVYTGTTVGALSQVALNDDQTSGVIRTSTVTFTATSGTTYYIAVDGWGGYFGAIALNVSFVANDAVAPSIGTQPVNTTVVSGQTAQFRVSASGTSPLTYQWQVSPPGSTGWTNLSSSGNYNGTTTAILSIYTSGSGLNNNSYRCLVSNAVGTVASDSGVLTVTGTAPTIGSQTSGTQTVTAGNSINFYINAAGTNPLSYRWQVSPPGTGGWTNLSNSSTYSNVTSSNLGILAQNQLNGYYYRCVVTNDFGTVASDSIILSVQPATPPSFGSVPATVTVNYGETLSIYVSVSGTSPFTFQWKKDGTAIAGATSSGLYRYNVTSADAGSYTLTATNAGGTATTSPIAVTVNAIQGPTITTQPVSLAVAKGFSASFWVNATGSPTLRYQWYFNGTAIAGATSSSYYFSAVAASNGGLYTVKVSNEAGNVTSSAAELVVLPPALPQISWTPGITTISTTNSSFSFYPSITGSPVMTYQWFKNGVAVPGATSSSYYKYNATEADVGKYTLRVSNEAGVVLSNEATVTWGVAGTSWLAVERVGDVVWFLAASPGRIMRYDLAQEAWLPIIYLSETKAPTAFWPTASGVFIAYGTELVWRDADLLAETAVATAGSSIRSLVGIGGFLYYADGTVHCIKIADRTAGPAPTVGYYSNAGFSRTFRPAPAPGLGYLFTTRPNTSPDDILRFSVALDGKISGEMDSPYHGDMAIGSKQFVSPDELLVFDNRGVVFRTSDLTYAGSVGTAFDDLAFFADSTPLVLRGKVLSAIDATSLVETGSYSLSSTGYSVFARQSNAFVFGAAPSTTSNPVVTKVSAASLVPASPGSVPIPTNQRISVDDAFIDPSGVIHLVSRTARGVVRWDSTTRTFLSTIPLRGIPSFSSYAPAVNRLVLNYSDGVLTNLDLDTDSSERAFANISAYNSTRSLVAMDDLAFLNINQAGVSANLRIVMGADGAVKYLSTWNYWGNSLAWQSATRLLYSTASFSSGNAVDAIAISADGIPATTVTGTSTNVVPPLRFGLNGALVLSSTGRILSSTLGELGQLTNPVTDGVWLADGLYTVRARPNGTELQKWARTTYALGDSLNLPGSPLRIFRVSESSLAVLSLVDGYLAFHLVSDTLTLTGSTVNDANYLAPPLVSAQPASLEVVTGDGATFTVHAEGSAPLQYFWQVSAPGSTSWTDLANGGVYSGANTATLTVTGATAGLSGNVYRCAIFNPAGHAISNWARLTVSAPAVPTVSGQPSSTTATVGAGANFTVGASGSPTLLYFWQVSEPGSTSWTDLTNGGVYSGVNAATLTITGATTGLNGNVYRCVIFNPVGHAISDWARLTVNPAPPPPSIANQPVSQNVIVGATVDFTVSVTGTGPFSYQWKKNGSNLSNGALISGATTDQLTIISAQIGDSGSYTVAIANAGGTATSNAATLNVYAHPGVISAATGQSHSLFITSDGTLWSMGSNLRGQLGIGSTVNSNVPVQVATNVVAVSQGIYNHTLFIKSDGTLWAIGYNAYNQLGDGTTTNALLPEQIASGVVSASTGGGHSLFIKSDGTLWGMGVNVAYALGDGTTTNRSTPIQIATGVVSASAGGDHSLFVKFDGTLWGMGEQNGSGQLGIGSTQYVTTPAQIASGVVTAFAGYRHSLFIKSDGTLWGMGHNDNGDLGDGTSTQRWSPVQLTTGVAAAATSWDHSLFIKSDGTLFAMGSNSSGEFGIGTNNFQNLAPIQLLSGVVAAAIGGGHSLVVKADGSLWAAGSNYNGELGDGTTNNRLSRVQVTGGPVQAPSAPDGVNATDDSVFQKTRINWNPTIGATGYDVWRHTANTPGAATRIATSISIPLLFDTTAVRGTTYYYWIKASNAAGTSGFSASATPEVAPLVATPPAHQSVLAGANASFTVGVSGSPTLLYFWQVSASGSTSWTDLVNGGVYSGVNSATLTITGATAGMNGNVYRCVIFNLAGHATSEWARLTVGSSLTAPAVTDQPASTTVAASANASFMVGVSGSPTLLYYWQVSAPGSTSWTDLVNGGVYSGVNSATLTITGATAGMNGNVYRCVIFNPAGHATSDWARLTVGSSLTAPAVTDQPASTTVAASANASFMVGVSGSPTLLYYWQVSAPGSTSWTDLVNGGVYSGVNSATLTITGATTGMSGNVYRCVIFNPAGHAVSDWTRLTVTSSFSEASPDSLIEPTGFEVWRHTKFTVAELTDPAISGPDAVYGSDGLTNLTKYALGLEPKQDETGVLGETFSDETEWSYVYPRPAGITDVVYTVQVSTDQGQWNVTGVAHELVSTSDGWELWQAHYPRSTGQSAVFRLVITRR